MDTTISALQREAATGDPAAEARLLVARLRAGTLTRERVELAAYCGSEVAQEVLDPGVRFATPDGRSLTGALDFRAWLDHLARRWADVGPVPGWVLVRAAVAAARVAWPAHLERAYGLGVDDQGRLYELDPGEWISRASLNEAMLPVVLAPLRAIEAAEAWLADPSEERWAVWHVAYVDAGHVAWLPPPGHDRSASSIDAAARLAGEAPVRSAICSALTSWALETPA